MRTLYPLILIVGPTASGKSALALRLADRYRGAILNCDSLQTYQRLDIGTAKPTRDERIQVDHFLFDFVPPGQVLTAGDFRREALKVLDRELPCRTLFGVGGSGFYIQALEKGMFDVPKPKPEVERQVRERLEKEGLSKAYQELLRLDPEYAGEINPNDGYRITRALVMIHDSGKTVTQIRQSFEAEKFPYPLLKLGLQPSREWLLPRVQERTARMLSDGLIQEVESLVRDGLEGWAPLQSVGYKECLQFLRGEVAFERLSDLINEKTMQLSKKQKTWFKRDSEIQWLDPSYPQEQAEECVGRFLDGLGLSS